MQSTSSRKGRTSITHLMNFTLPPRPQNHQQNHFGRSTRRNATWGLGSGYHAADKARYVHANYRFIVNPKGNYHAQAMDADVHLDWSNVLQILVSAESQSTNCPICLSTPVAPRMAKCGHIFCLPCLIRYMHSSDDTNPTAEKKARWRKCPICWDSIYISETRPVRWFTGQEGERPQEGGDVVLRLIMRQPGSTLALPRDGAEVLDKAEDIPWYFAAEVMDYARVMKGSEDYMNVQFESEIEGLQRQEKEDELMFGDETQWSKRAVASVIEAKDKLKGIGNPPSAPEQPSERKSRRPPVEYLNNHHDILPDYYDIQHAAKSGQSSSKSSTPAQDRTLESSPDHLMRASSTSPSNNPTFRRNNTSVSPHWLPPVSRPSVPSLSRLRETSKAPSNSSHHDQPFFFYEALLHYYLSPLDIRILKAAFGDFASFPSTILPRVERVSTGHIIDDELRRRAKYLAHLPHGCEVGFLECDWTDVVVPEILSAFAPEIDRRRKKNTEKEAREEKERLRAEREEDDKRWAAARRKRPILTEDIVSEADFQPLPDASSVDFATASSSPPWSSTRTQNESGFATLASPSTSPNAAKTVWGTRIVVPASPPMLASVQEHDPSENDGWLQDWERDLLQEDDLATQLEASVIESENTKQGVSSANSKKKKGKKITLMTTNARRGA